MLVRTLARRALVRMLSRNERERPQSGQWRVRGKQWRQGVNLADGQGSDFEGAAHLQGPISSRSAQVQHLAVVGGLALGMGGQPKPMLQRDDSGLMPCPRAADQGRFQANAVPAGLT